MQKLSEHITHKRHFNPSVKKDRDLAYRFLETYTWKNLTTSGTCPWFCEWPYLEIPAMLKDKLVEYYSKKR